VFQNKTIVGQYRGVGHPIGVAIGEYLIEKAAAQLGIEPAELRLRNYISDDSYPIRTRTGIDLEALSHQKCMRRLLELIDLPELRAEHEALRREGIFRGIGFATFVERTATASQSAAHLRKATWQDGITLAIDPSGAVRCAITVTDQGQGTHAVIGQIVADALASAQIGSALFQAIAKRRPMAPAFAPLAARRSAANWRCWHRDSCARSF